MNVFLLGWNLSPDILDAALKEFRRMIEVYPQLDLTTCRHEISADGNTFTATMHHALEVIGPRRYVWEDNDEITLYDGVLFDSTGGFAAHDAVELAQHWEELPEKLEGQFVVARVKQKPASLEVMTDVLGYVQVYYCQRGRSWLISNSVRPLVRLCRAYDFDPLGVSMFLSQTWVWDDRTLHQDIHTIPGGQLWKFEEDQSEPKKHIYCPAVSLVSRRKQCLSPKQIQNLAEQISLPCRLMSETMGPLQCDVTGGRDSRVLTSLLEQERLESTYYTSGERKSKDMMIASQIVRKFNLSHKIVTMTNKDILSAWDILCERLIRQGDGMISMWQLHNLSDKPQKIDRLIVSITGVISGNYYNPLEALQTHSTDQIEQMLIDYLVYRYGGLVLPEARNLSSAAIRKKIQEYFDQGIFGIDALDAFNWYQRVGRWAGCNRNRNSPVYDLFAPFCIRPIIRATYRIPPIYRYYRWLNHQLLRVFMPSLLRLPYDKGRNWPIYPWLNLLQWMMQKSLHKVFRYTYRFRRPRSIAGNQDSPSEFCQEAWLEPKREWMRQICLDQRSSVLWNFVNRSLFEQIMSDSSDPAERRAYRLGLFGIVTLFYYTDTLKRLK